MTYATGPQSMLTMIVNVLSQQIRTDPTLFQSSGTINVLEITQAQWGNCGPIYNNLLVGLPTTYSLANMDEVFSYPPEFGAYILDPIYGNSSQSYGFNITMSRDLLSADPTSFVSFLNSENMQYFYETYEIGEYDSLKQRFGFDNDK